MRLKSSLTAESANVKAHAEFGRARLPPSRKETVLLGRSHGLPIGCFEMTPRYATGVSHKFVKHRTKWMNDKQRRNKTFVDPPVQQSLIKRMVLHWVVYVLAAMTLTFVIQFFGDPFKPLKWHLSEMWWNQAPSLLALVVLLPMFVLDSVKVSNKFTGPIMRLRTAIADISAGRKSEPLSFREGDFWKSLARDFNTMVSQISDKQRQAGA